MVLYIFAQTENALKKPQTDFKKLWQLVFQKLQPISKKSRPCGLKSDAYWLLCVKSRIGTLQPNLANKKSLFKLVFMPGTLWPRWYLRSRGREIGPTSDQNS